MNDRIRFCERGVTLMEVLLGVLSIGILTTVAVPQYITFAQNMHLKAAARELYGVFQQAKNEAIKRNETVLIAFEPSLGKYQMFVDSLPTNAQNRQLDAGEEILVNRRVPEDIEIVSVNFGGALTGGFTPQGRPSGGTGHVIIRHKENGKEYKLTTSVAGYVHLK